ncbi:hypothetical protein G6O67_007215 [Ophiocordyceps sinensis]|uniref:chitinase n=1 Tax=Ophiocordyceps sinensis TaxID=72228 RepID=A0A8H4LTG5_9HYPO|nr:hypothetical protein G6O67_007215 [Ophiocordyceps sinensis]
MRLLPALLFCSIAAADDSVSGQLDPCPKSCEAAGANPADWTHIHDAITFTRCKKNLLFDTNVHGLHPADQVFRVCAMDTAAPLAKRTLAPSVAADHSNTTMRLDGTKSRRSIDSYGCGAHLSAVPVVVTTGPTLLKAGHDAAMAVENLADYLANKAPCGTTIMFAKSGSAFVGLYVGAEINKSSFGRLLGGYRLAKNSTITHTLARRGDCKAIQVEEGDRCADLSRRCAIRGALFLEYNPKSNLCSSLVPKQWVCCSAGNLPDMKPKPQSDCRAIQVVEGDSCAALSQRCAIRGTHFVEYNPKSDLCSSLMPKQWVCCSAGDLPDRKPKPQSDGTCAAYVVVANDNCWAIADNHGLGIKDIEDMNSKTWGWTGCSRLMIGQTICLSKGNTPMPGQLEGLACGPQKPGTRKPSAAFDGWDLAKLSPCPLNACCSGWGYCGTTTEHCTDSPADSGAPGAFEPGTNGCISNCGTDIVGNESTPDAFGRLYYFQGYNGNRGCMNMDVTQVEDAAKGITHLHFAFAGITEDFKVHIPAEAREQFDKFSAIKVPFRKIISIGGWAESTEPATFQRYRDAVKPENRFIFAKNVLDFIDSHDLQGVDFDWEYPGAPDIPGIPPGDPIEGLNYLRFLITMRTLLGEGSTRSLSIALPSSYWYLKAFPVDLMAEYVSYFVYMTYDLHGQWDYGNRFSNPGCPTGNCLRSHVNVTETYDALALISKAGVPPSKVFVGVASYGRSFRMTDSMCDEPFCTFTGSFSVSEAEPGPCTGVGGYISNGEILEIQSNSLLGVEDFDAATWYDEASGSNIMTCASKVPAHCRALAAFRILLLDLDTAIDDYMMVSEDYDDKFTWYADWVKDLVDERLDEFMAIGRGEGLKYMDCKWDTWQNNGQGPCTEVVLSHDLGLYPGPRVVEFTMRDENGFYKALLKHTGIMKEWIEWKDDAQVDACNPCGYGIEVCSELAMCTNNYFMRKNLPRRIDKDKINVENPKAMVDAAIPSLSELGNLGIATYFDLRLGSMNVSESDALTAFSMPVFMLQDASESIKEIKKIGEEQKEKKTRELIFMILNIVFAVIPFAGLGGSLVGGVTRLAMMATLIGELGSFAVGIAEIVEDPASAPFVVLGMLLGATGIRVKGPRIAFRDAAQARHALGPEQLKLFSPAFRRKDEIVQRLVKKCIT